MDGLWPWLAVAGAGALHGLNPASGWLWAAARGVRSGDRAQLRRALWPIAIGHAASLAVVAGVVALGVAIDRGVMVAIAGAMLVGVTALHRRGRDMGGSSAADAGLALCSFMTSTAHGAGLMLVPALIPLCLGEAPGREITASGSMVLAIGAVGIHAAAMLAVTFALARGSWCGWRAMRGDDAARVVDRSRQMR